MKIIPHRPDKNQEYKNEFKENNIYPFNKIGRCIIDKITGEIKRWCNELDSNLDTEDNPINLDIENEDVMVYIPAFYYKRIWEGEILTDSILNKIPNGLEFQGYKLHPAFIRPNNTIRHYILVGAFIGHIDDDNILRSIPNVFSTSSKTQTEFRYSARQSRNNNFNLLTMEVYSALQILYKISFQNLDSSISLGYGTTYLHGVTPNDNVFYTGKTMELGNRCGYLNKNGDDISFLGIENIYGQRYQVIDGLYIKSDGYLYTNDPNKFDDISSYKKYEIKTILNRTSKQTMFLEKILKINSDEYLNIFNLPGKFMEQSNYLKYYADCMYYHNINQDDLNTINIIGVGGVIVGSGTEYQDFVNNYFGIFSGVYNFSINYKHGFIGTRLIFLP